MLQFIHARCANSHYGGKIISMNIFIRSWNDPEFVITRENHKELANYVGKKVGLVPVSILNKTHGGRLYHEGILIDGDCCDENDNPTTDKYYAIEESNGNYIVEIGDGLFVNHLPTQPVICNPDQN